MAAPPRKPAPVPEPEPEVPGLAVRFPTAAAALLFAGRVGALARLGEADHRRAADGSGWWVLVDLPLDLCRTLAEATRGELFLVGPEGLVRDRGWGDREGALAHAASPRGPALADLHPVPLLDLLRQAGLHETPTPPLQQAVVLLRAHLATGVLRRALDLRLDVTYRPTRLHPLFPEPKREPAPLPAARLTSAGSGVVLELTLSVARGSLPAGFLDALRRDPNVLLCRTADAGALLVQYGYGSPLGDEALLELAGRDRWLLASAEFGCARLETLGEPLDAAALVRLADDRPLRDAGPAPQWADAEALAPGAPRLTVVPARTPEAEVDAVLLTDAELDSVRLMLEGHRLAETAQLVPGRDHHLLLAPGGLLERLPLGELLHCLGPGPLYLPLGHRTDPLLPPATRQELLGADPDTAIVLTARARYAFDLTLHRPAWRLWAGPLPELDLQLPPDAREILADIDEDLTPPPSPPPAEARQVPRPAEPRFRAPTESRFPRARVRTWRDNAFDAERRGDIDGLVEAAEIHERHGASLQAAHLYERAARLAADRGGDR